MRHAYNHLILGALLLVGLFFSGCQGNRAHRDDNAKMAANLYACGEALMKGGDPARIGTAVRLYAIKFAETHGYSIAGADEWKKSVETK